MIWILFSSIVFATPNPTKTLVFDNGKTLQVEVAETFESRARGLMHRTQLAENAGMLFVFDHPQILTFWMKNTFIPLSIAYLGADKKIKEIHQMKAQSMMDRVQDHGSYRSQCQCVYAIEVNQGWFKKNKIKVGSSVAIKPTSKTPDEGR